MAELLPRRRHAIHLVRALSDRRAADRRLHPDGELRLLPLRVLPLGFDSPGGREGVAVRAVVPQDGPPAPENPRHRRWTRILRRWPRRSHVEVTLPDGGRYTGKLERWRDGEMPQYLNKTTNKWTRSGDTAHGYGFTDDATGKWFECWDDDARPTGYAGLLKRSE